MSDLLTQIPEAIIFDADGVIFDSEKLWDVGDRKFLKGKGADKFPEEIKSRLAGTSLLEGTAMLLESIGLDTNVEEAAKERIKIMEELYATRIEFLPGFLSFHDYVIKNNFKTCVATSMSRHLFPLIDRRTDFLSLFEGKVYSVTSVEKAKPAPDIYLYAAEKIQADPKKCLVIEDSPNGIKAANAAGMFTVGLASTFEPQHLSEADIVFKTFHMIESFIENSK